MIHVHIAGNLFTELGPSSIAGLLGALFALAAAVLSFINRRRIQTVQLTVNGRYERMLRKISGMEKEIAQLRADLKAEKARPKRGG